LEQLSFKCRRWFSKNVFDEKTGLHQTLTFHYFQFC